MKRKIMNNPMAFVLALLVAVALLYFFVISPFLTKQPNSEEVHSEEETISSSTTEIENSILANQIDDLESQLDSQSQELEDLREENNSLESQNTELQEELNSLKSAGSPVEESLKDFLDTYFRPDGKKYHLADGIHLFNNLDCVGEEIDTSNIVFLQTRSLQYEPNPNGSIPYAVYDGNALYFTLQSPLFWEITE